MGGGGGYVYRNTCYSLLLLYYTHTLLHTPCMSLTQEDGGVFETGWFARTHGTEALLCLFPPSLLWKGCVSSHHAPSCGEEETYYYHGEEKWLGFLDGMPLPLY